MQGAQGFTSFNGPTSLRGTQGPQGFQGDAGFTSTAPGVQGPQGRQGWQGLNNFRVLSSGTTTVVAGTEGAVSTVTRRTNEKLTMMIFDSTTGAVSAGFDNTASGIPAGAFAAYLMSTGVANQATLAFSNQAAANQSIDWLILGVTG